MNSFSQENNDLEAGTRDIAAQSISRWRRAAVVLFASRRFLQIVYLKKEGEKEQASSKVHAHAAVQAELAFEIEPGEEVIGTSLRPTSTTGDFGIGREELDALTKNDDVGSLEQYGGIEKLESELKTNLKDGINGEDADVLKRKRDFGANTHTPEKSTSFLTCLWEACHQDISLIIFIVVAVACSVMGLATKGTRFGYWEEGGNVATVVMVNIIFKATCKYSLSLIHNVKEEGRIMHLKVVRGGKQFEVSICDIVVGDVIPLNIGDQVPAYGILITARSLSIDTSRVNGANNIVSLHASSGASRLKPGWKIADGSGTMLVTSVGICTKSELSQDIGNKTTLEEVLNVVATSIGNVGLAVAFIAVMVVLLRWFTGHNLEGSPKFIGVKTKPRDVIEEVNQIIIIAITIAVVAVPQGLPLAVTLTIVSATKRMVADNNAFVCEIAYRNEASKWRRFVHANIITFMQLQLTVNVVALTTNFTVAVFDGHVPLNAVQLLWVNLLIVPQSLVTKPPVDELMPGLLIEPGQPLKRYIKWKRLVFQGVYQIVAILIINFQGRSLLKSYTRGHAIKVKNTMIFNTFVVCQVIHQLEARKKGILSNPKKWITSNYLFMGIAGTILLSQFIIIEFLGKAFSTVALNQKEWQFSLTLGFFEMLFAIILFLKYLTHRN
ncbi:PREDICTED: calcium-transporting ATPase 10, plasma membrane-type-like [Prunus mume]|uniref:Calcium-transporting ATPase 10, plasma membrane-type-like n=1 Tax=Prunus mume TaxID=102107 RepID=A0ABM0NF40_PRUMU|nr:PREDICTED: calcium-transporting ATPase 10, plasma membrane-type-like [Prunus mume]